MIAPRARHRRIALILLAASLSRGAFAEEPVVLALSLEASLPDSASLGLSLVRGDARARLELSADGQAASLALPWLALGALEPAGLAAFIQRPQGLSYRLGRYAARPFSAPAPLDAPLLGAAAGGQGGCFVMDAQAGGLPSWSGAWLSPRGSPLSALTARAYLPAEAGDGSWDDPPAPGMERRWHALGAAFRLGPWRSALGAGAMASSPGDDAWALRLENLLELWAFRLESVAALSLGPWRGPSGSLAPACLVDARLDAKSGRLALRLDYEESRDAWGDPPSRGLLLGALAQAGPAELEGSLEASFLGSAPARGLTFRWQASLPNLPRLAAYGSWALARPESGVLGAEGLAPDSLELGCSLKAGSTHAFSVDALWRVDTEGRYLKLAGSYAYRLPRGRLLVYLKTDGWFRYDPSRIASAAGALSEAGLRYSQTYP